MLWVRAVIATTSRSFPSGAKRNEESRIPKTSNPGPPNLTMANKRAERCFIGRQASVVVLGPPALPTTRFPPKAPRDLLARRSDLPLRTKAHTRRAAPGGRWDGRRNEPAFKLYPYPAPGR